MNFPTLHGHVKPNHWRYLSEHTITSPNCWISKVIWSLQYHEIYQKIKTYKRVGWILKCKKDPTLNRRRAKSMSNLMEGKEEAHWSTLKSKLHFEYTYLMLRQLVITSFSPLSDCGTMKNHNSEIWVQKKYPVSCYGSYIKKSWFWARVEWVRNKGRLYHHNWVDNIFPVQDHSKVCSFIRTIIEDLKAL